MKQKPNIVKTLSKTLAAYVHELETEIQILTNYRNKSADGLSLYFLMNWLLGDLANLAGCILTKQLPFQNLDYELTLDSEVPHGSRFSMISLRDSILEGAKKSYTFPELKKGTHKRIKSVEGLSILLFIFAALANLAYTLCILTNPLASKDTSFLREAVPYILGAIGTLSFDSVVFLQWLAWRDPDRRKFRRSQSYSRSEIDYQQVPNVRNSRNSGTLYDHRRHDYMIDDGFLA
ncbi:4876_t:CDS:2 [Scutellospora calospora]|uniref:4876_t:CDS:1 n=1 Tax=Scutellospora calospora TaxID=85575 RepID=A0ACA9KNA1_9GLOM|nr:4876_t:CDS:2 [Scutellospora calospora]